MRHQFDQPQDLAILRMLAKAGRRWQGAASVRAAVEWLDSLEHPLSTVTWRRLGEMVEAGLVEARKARGTGQEWRLRQDASLRWYTGGIDVLLLDRDEALTASSGKDRVAFDPKAYMKHRTGKEQASRALLQCPSPWDLGDRMQKIKWTNPELV